MRICIHKTSGKIIEAQSHATEGTLLKNATTAGLLASEYEEQVVTDAEYLALSAAQPLSSDEVIKKVKAEAQRRIFTRLPGATLENYQDKELNYLGRQAELDAIVLGTYRNSNGDLQPARALTQSEINEVAVISAFWAWVKSNRAASNDVEADWVAAGYAANFDYKNSLRWPT